MKTFQVWVSSDTDVCSVQVDGLRNTEWLLNRLSQFFVFKTSEAVREDLETTSFTFSVIHSFHMTQAKFERLLASIPEVRLTRVRSKRPAERVQDFFGTGSHKLVQKDAANTRAF